MANSIENQKHSAIIDFAKDIPGGISIIGTTIEDGEYAGGEPVTLKVLYMAYDSDKREYVQNDETYQKALELVTSWGATSIETAALELMGQVIPEVYVADGQSKLTPIVPRVQFDWPEKPAEKKYLEKNDVEITSLPIQESVYAGKERINIYGEVPMGDGSTKTYRFSQIIVEDPTGKVADQTIGLKTHSKEANDLAEQLKNNEIPANAIESVKKAIEQMRKQARNRVVNELSRAFGTDFNKLIEDGGTVTGLAKVNQIPGQDQYFPVLQIELTSAD